MDTIGNPAHVTVMKDSLRKQLAAPFFKIMNRFLGVGLNVIWILEGMEGKVAFKQAALSTGATSIASHKQFPAFRKLMNTLHPRWNDGMHKKSNDTWLRNVLSEGAVVTAEGTLVFWSFSGCNITGFQYRTFSERCYCEAMLARWWRGEQGLATCDLVTIAGTPYNDLYIGGGKDLPLPRELREQQRRRMHDMFKAKTGPFSPEAIAANRKALAEREDLEHKTGMISPEAVAANRKALAERKDLEHKTGMFSPEALAANRKANNFEGKTGIFSPEAVAANRKANNFEHKTGIFSPEAVAANRKALAEREDLEHKTGMFSPEAFAKSVATKKRTPTKAQLAHAAFKAACDARETELGVDAYRIWP